MEKLLKTLDVLKSLSSSDALPGISSAMVTAGDSIKTKNERISCCRTVTEALCTKHNQQLKEYTSMFEKGIEVFFILCSDDDPDIRLAASDSLIELIKVLKEKPFHKLQSEIYREIKRNLLPKSMKKAIVLFADVTQNIRSQKCRIYMASLVPCFQALAKRTEEALFENLDVPMRKIFKHLAPFLNDEEASALRKDFILNLESNSAIIRRTSSIILVSFAELSRKPITQLSILLKDIIDVLTPNVMQKSYSLIIGASLCMRRVIEAIYAKIHFRSTQAWKGNEVFNEEEIASNIIRVYEMSVVLCNHDDHNVITASLETLQQMFNSPIDSVLKKLTSLSGIKNSLDCAKIIPSTDIISPTRRLSVSEDTYLLEGDEDIPTIHTSISGIGVDIPVTDEPSLSNTSSSEFHRHKSDEDIREKNPTAEVHNLIEIYIGSLHDDKVPLYFCSRFLAYNFLLSGVKGKLRPDSEVRVSVKVLTMNCLANIINICPEVFYFPLPAMGSGADQRIYDVSRYSKHQDPVLRGASFLIYGYMIKNFDRCEIPQELRKTYDLEYFHKRLSKGFKDKSNVVVKCSLAGMEVCWKELFNDTENDKFDDLLESSLSLARNSYWLIKVDFIDLVSSINWNYLQMSNNMQEFILCNLVLSVSNEDVRVRAAASKALTKFVKMGSGEDSPCSNACDLRFSKNHNKDKLCLCKRRLKLSDRFETVMKSFFPYPPEMTSKCVIAGYFSIISQLSEEFNPKFYKKEWNCLGRSPFLLNYMMDLLRCSDTIYDLGYHHDVLTVTCRLVFALHESNNEPVSLKNQLLKEMLFTHCLAIIKIYNDVTDVNQMPKRSSSPQASPVKKISLKLDNSDKKFIDDLDKNLFARSTALKSTTHFKKIEVSIKASWELFKRTLDPISSQKFTSLLRKSFSFLEELTIILSESFHLGTFMEEMLKMIWGVLHLCPVEATKCTKTMLKILFKTEANGDFDNLEETPTIYDEAFIDFCENFVEKQISKLSEPKAEVKLDLTKFGNYVRQFEQIVIDALKIYTTTSDVIVQIEVLSFLNQLVRLHVNYSMIDSKEVFLGFVIKQIEMLKHGDINDPQSLVKDLFEFLFLLTREHKESKRYITIGTIVKLCEGLVESGENPLTHAIPALTVVVFELFLRMVIPPLELPETELETLRGNVFQMSLKFVNIPQALGIFWMIGQGAKYFGSETALIKYSNVIQRTFVRAISEGELRIDKSRDRYMLDLTLLCLKLDEIHYAERIEILELILTKKINNIEDFEKASLLLYTVWISLLKTVEPETINRSSPLDGRFVLNLYYFFISHYCKFYGQMNNDEIISHQLDRFLREFHSAFTTENSKELFEQMHLEENKDVLFKLLDSLLLNRSYGFSLRKAVGTFIYKIDCPHIDIWEKLLNSMLCRADSEHVFLLLLDKLTIGSLEGEEEFVITNHPIKLMEYLPYVQGKKFVSSLSNSLLNKLIQELIKHLTLFNLPKDGYNPDLTLVNMIYFVRDFCEEFHGKQAVLALMIINLTEVADYCYQLCRLLTSVFLDVFTNDIPIEQHDKEFIYLATDNDYLKTRYPRVRTLALQIVGRTDEEIFRLTLNSSVQLMERLPLFVLGTEEMIQSEGVALAKMLSTLSYTKIADSFSQKTLNFSIISYSVAFLKESYLTGSLSTEDALDLLSSDRRSQHIYKHPLGVATIEKILDILDKWENSTKSQNILGDETHDFLSKFCSTMSSPKRGKRNNIVKKIEELNFKNNLQFIWDALSEFIEFKRAIESGQQTPGQNNNFIPVTIFTISFLLIKCICEDVEADKGFKFDSIEKFLEFGSKAIFDPNFLHYLNKAENFAHVSACISSLVSVTKCIEDVFHFSIDALSNEAVLQPIHNDEANTDATFSRLIGNFIYLTNFAFVVSSKKIELRGKIADSLLKVVSGFGRCDGINNWTLIANLDSSVETIVKNSAYHIHQIPLEILQNELEQLKFYIFKCEPEFLLAMFEFVSKVQFEENWMTFLSVINSYVMDSSQLHIVSTGLKGIAMMLQASVTVTYLPIDEEVSTFAIEDQMNIMMKDCEPETCKNIHLPRIMKNDKKVLNNTLAIDLTSVLRFLKDLLTQWLLGNQVKIPLLHLSAVISCLVSVMEYFEEPEDYVWVHSTLLEIYNNVDKEDEILFDHLIYGIFFSGARIPLGDDEMGVLVKILDNSFNSSSANVGLSGVKGALAFLLTQPDNQHILNAIYPILLKNSELSETLNHSESYSIQLWNLLLVSWIYSPSCEIHQKEILDRICTILSPLNDVYLSVRLLVLKGLRLKYQKLVLKEELNKTISRLALESMKSANLSVFFESVKLFGTIVYIDFSGFYRKILEPEISMKIMEIFEHFVQMLKSGVRTRCEIVSTFIPHLVSDFLAPSEIINRVLAEYLNNQQSNPELLMKTLSQIFVKARNAKAEGEIIREWIISNMSNLISNPDVERIVWSLTTFFIGISRDDQIFSLLPVAQIKKRIPQENSLFGAAVIDFYHSLNIKQKEEFMELLGQGPFPEGGLNPYKDILSLIEMSTPVVN